MKLNRLRQQLKIKTLEQYAEELNTWLDLLGARAVTFCDAADQPILEPELNTTPLWSRIEITALFDQTIDPEKILTFLKNKLDDQAILSYDFTPVKEENWERAWLRDFHPMRFGKKLWVCPSVETPPDPSAVNVILDPGLAFGTGTHPTTALCLEWLDANPPRDEIVIDYGCGSGILAIAAIKLGARKVWAVDHDPQALEATYANAEKNHIDLFRLKIVSPDDLPNLHVDLLLANILANPLIQLAPHLEKLLKPRGKIVLSGILKDQITDVNNVYQKWFHMQPFQLKEDWACLVGTRC